MGVYLIHYKLQTEGKDYKLADTRNTDNILRMFAGLRVNKWVKKLAAGDNLDKLGHKPVVTASPKLPSLPGPDVHADEFSPKTQPPGYSTHASWTVDIAEDSTPAMTPNKRQIIAMP